MHNIPFSKIIAGTMTWGVWGRKCNTTEMIELMNRCIENGITSFDHADIYGDYSTEADFGLAFSESKIDRKSIQLISKCGIQMESSKRSNKVKHYNYSASYIIWSAEQSLSNLKTDYLDLLLLHRPSPLMKSDEVNEAITKLKQEGKILDFGVSNFTPAQTDLIEMKTKVNYNQIEFSLTHYDAMLDGSLDYMQKQNIVTMAWAPLGDVFRKNDERTNRIGNQLSELSEKYGVADDIILFAWILKHPAGILPVCGTSDPKRISNLMKATTIDLELQDWFSLWTASAGVPVP